MDTQTRHALKHNALVDTAQSGMDWLQENKSSVLLFSAVLVAVLVFGIGGIVLYQQRQDQAQAAFGQAMEAYLTPIAQPSTPPQPGVKTFPSIAARAAEANTEFLKVADSYGWTDAGRNAEYFAGLTYMDMGKNTQAEQALHQVAEHSDKNLAGLAQMALAGLDQQTGRTADAIQIYQQLIAHPVTMVPVGTAKLALAALYEKTNLQQAKQIYAELKDKDKDTAAGQIATQKLAQLN